MPGGIDVFGSGSEPGRWASRWAAVPRRWRRAAVAGGVVVLLGAAGVGLRARAEERAAAGEVRVAAALRVETSSTSPPGGAVRYSVAVRNDGGRPVTLLSLTAGAAGLRVSGRGGAVPVAPGAEAQIPVSARLTCPADPAGPLTAALRIGRPDGGATTLRVLVTAAAPLLGAAATLCAVRPGLRDHELSGPVAGGVDQG